MSIDKRDFVTVVTLSLVFFLMASWNLGVQDVPTSTWRVYGGEAFYLDLGSPEKVDAVYLLVKRGEINLKVYTGYSGSWNEEGAVYIHDYYSWEKISVDRETRFIRFVFERSSGEIAEIAVLSEEGQKISLSAISGEKGEDEVLGRLIDEQRKVECPPTYMSMTYFDEIYYVRTAEDYINLEEPYEWTHPPLGKLIIAAGVLTFGYNPFGWRIMGVIFATLMIPVIYLFGKEISRTWIGAFASAFLLTFDFMHFTMARMATVETFVVFFALTSQFFFFIYFRDVLRNGWKASTRPLFLAVVFFSFGFSTKWYVLYGFVGEILLLLLVFRFRNRLGFKDGGAARVKAFSSFPFVTVLGLVVVSAAIYMSTFIPYMLIGHTLKDFYNRQWSMYIYHSTLTATHPFSSQWWSWPLLLKPVWLYVSELPGVVSTIVAMGNPAVWWFGFASVISAVGKMIRKKDRAYLFILAVFFFQWVPYILIPRCLFLYHFYVNVPLLCLATTYFLNELYDNGGKMAGLVYLIVVSVLFVLFYPVISGNPAPYWWREYLKLFRSWVF